VKEGEILRDVPEDFALLGDRTRLRLLRLLAERPLTVGELTGPLGVSQSAVSQHLARLRHARLVIDERQGQQVLYHLQTAELQSLFAEASAIFATPLAEHALWTTQPDRLNQVFWPVEVAVQNGGRAVPALSEQPSILFVCTGNSARSQMAEGFARAYGGSRVKVLSAGLEPAGVHPMAIEVMDEAGIDISQHTSKALLPDHLSQADLVVTLCGGPTGWRPRGDHAFAWRYWPLPDPARATGARYRRLARFRQVRESIRDHVLRLLGETEPTPAGL
jgi:arsenate reductase